MVELRGAGEGHGAEERILSIAWGLGHVGNRAYHLIRSEESEEFGGKRAEDCQSWALESRGMYVLWLIGSVVRAKD